MDIRRLSLWAGRTASVLSNDAVHAVIEDQGGMILEFSAPNRLGGRLNAHGVPWYHGHGMSVYNDDNHDFWRDEQLLYHRAGGYFSFPNVGMTSRVGDVLHPYDGASSRGYWMVERYGTDPEFGGVWLLSTLRNKEDGNQWRIRKVDVMLPFHPVLYSGYIMTNTGSSPLQAEASFQSLLGAPFLESDSYISSVASHWYVSEYQELPSIQRRLQPGAVFEKLKQAPGFGGDTVDMSVFSGMTGTADFISGLVPRDAPLSWTVAVNPRQQMAYVVFAPGPAYRGEGHVPADYTHFGFNYGGFQRTPYALYDGGTGLSGEIVCGMGVYHKDSGLAQAVVQGQCDGVPTFFTLEPGENRSWMSAIAFTAYENARMNAGLHSVEATQDSLILKRTKSVIPIPADTSFHALKTIMGRVGYSL
ncbi:hypothetical protein [Parasphaerochaeta coccoides]|uniref:Uncharacterized protein n=1 Tax=Parasphaerochaeta coccoides (strain ATCC BAA-1237 / DSM 17374 / SPN1) TaxID=760011 RepID=F4GM38_PARC1|nr:hypothetical protein [Parasphaerochaeta coccoides]AEC02513.1 hypothetical protein Spico_1305 [Parasphaerochaeta coccoides DSM 17374]